MNSNSENYLQINRRSWNNKVESHYRSKFYDVKSFLQGQSSLNSIELDLLGDIKGKSILHLQCHFGQDTISLGRMGAEATGVDFSDLAIKKAKLLASDCQLEVSFICCDIYDLPDHLDSRFDIVFTSYGTIGWLPDLNQWAAIIDNYLKPGGKFIMAEFHPVVWMFDDDFKNIAYHYFNTKAISGSETGTYADRDAKISQDFVVWNHSLSEVFEGLLSHDLSILNFREFNYSPYNCFEHTEKIAPNKYRIKHLEDKIPLVFAIKALKKIS